MEDADEVLALRRVDAGLAADRAIDLREQGRRNLDEANAAAQNAVKKWVYEPRKENGVAVASQAQARLVFAAAD